MQYGPARQSSRACAKMLVRAGHRCSVCYCLISLCSCHHGKLNSISCSGHGSHAAHSHPEPAHASSCVSQAADLLFRVRFGASEYQLYSVACLSSPPAPPRMATSTPSPSGRFCIDPIRGSNGERTNTGPCPQLLHRVSFMQFSIGCTLVALWLS